MLKILIFTTLIALFDAAPSSRVVNGTDANIEDYPFMVSIRDGEVHNCGGSILNEKWILSAAHCSGTSVEVGTDNLEKGQLIKILRWIRHEKYDRYTIENDVAVVELVEPIKFGSKSQPVKLPEQFYEVPGSWSVKANLTGFGLDSSWGEVQTHLQKAELLVVSNEDCNRVHYNQVYPGMLCAGVPEGGRGQCSGDSGGPLTMNGVQIGIVSWSVKPCTVAPYPGVYTKVSHYVDWIRNKTELKFQ